MGDAEPKAGTSTAGPPSVAALKAFAHPLRIRLYYALRNARVATVSTLANSVESSVALVSYHLRQLHQHGFIEPAPERARDARERWWRLSDQRLRWNDSSVLDRPEAAALAAMIKNSAAIEQYRQIQEFHESDTWDADWPDAAFMADGSLDLTRAELTDMHAELMTVIGRYAERSKRRHPGRSGVERVMYVLHGFPVRE